MWIFESTVLHHRWLLQLRKTQELFWQVLQPNWLRILLSTVYPMLAKSADVRIRPVFYPAEGTSARSVRNRCWNIGTTAHTWRLASLIWRRYSLIEHHTNESSFSLSIVACAMLKPGIQLWRFCTRVPHKSGVAQLYSDSLLLSNTVIKIFMKITLSTFESISSDM